MAKVFLKNTAEHDVTLTISRGTETLAETIPAGVQGPEGFAPGTASVEEEFLEEAKKNDVVKFYFESGKLVEMKAPAPKKETK